MTPAQTKRLEDLLDSVKSLISDIEEGARDSAFMEGEDYTRAMMDVADIAAEDGA